MSKRGTSTRYPGVKRLDDGRYLVRWKVKCSKTGRVIESERIITAPSPQEASRIRAELRQSMEQAPIPGEQRRLHEYAASWLESKVRDLKPSTLERYASTLLSHVLPAMGDFYVDAIRHVDIVKWRDSQRAEASTINSRLHVLKTLMADATIALDLRKDPCSRVPGLRVRRKIDEDPNLLTAPQLAAFLNAAKRLYEDRWYPLLATLAMTAMRVGEATALKWKDIDEARGLIYVRRAQWRGQIGTTKTGIVRTVPMPDELSQILSEHKTRAELAPYAVMSLRKVEGAKRALKEGWVFPDTNGNPTGTQTLRKPLLAVLRAIERDAGVERLTVHGLRRTMNNLLRQVTQGEVVRSVTGHVTEQMTEHYSHVSAAEKQAAVARVMTLVATSAESEDRL